MDSNTTSENTAAVQVQSSKPKSRRNMFVGIVLAAAAIIVVVAIMISLMGTGSAPGSDNNNYEGLIIAPASDFTLTALDVQGEWRASSDNPSGPFAANARGSAGHYMFYGSSTESTATTKLASFAVIFYSIGDAERFLSDMVDDQSSAQVSHITSGGIGDDMYQAVSNSGSGDDAAFTIVFRENNVVCITQIVYDPSSYSLSQDWLRSLAEKQYDKIVAAM